MTITQMKAELSDLGYPVEKYSDQKILRIYPRAIVAIEVIYEDLIRRGFSVHDISEHRLKWIYSYSITEGWSIHQKAMDNGIYDERFSHRKNGDDICQDESFI